MSKAANYLKAKYGSETITPNVIKSVSQFRRGEIEDNFQKNSGINDIQQSYTTATSIRRNAQVSSSGGGYAGAGDTANQVPNVYSPLWLDSNLSLPRDRATINAWLRAFYALNPFVHNSINLHSTYPISKLNIKCKNKKIENFFNDMCEEIDLMNVCVQIAQEYWLLGEAFPFVELNEEKLKWSRITILNPDYIVVKKTIVEDEPLIMMKPDENLKRIVTSNKAADIEQRRQLNPYIVNCVLKGQNIPLDNFQVSHLARRISPYENRGTGLPVCIFRQLMLLDKLRECYDEETEVLTDSGFKKIFDLLEDSSLASSSAKNVVGVFNDGNVLKLKENVKIACFNKDTEFLEYHKPIDMVLKKHSGKMIKFKSNKLDILVTPDHQMLNQKHNRINGKNGWNGWEKKSAKDIKPTITSRFRGLANYSGEKLDFINILGKNVEINLYLKFLGYLLSEGHISKKKDYLTLTQSISSDCYDDIKQTLIEFGKVFDKKTSHDIKEIKDYESHRFKNKPSNVWQGRLHSKKICEFLFNEISSNNSSKSLNKKIPIAIKQLDKKHLKVLLNCLVLGDGSNIKNRSSDAFKYYTISEQLSNDVQEIAFKCGYTPVMGKRKIKSGSIEYTIRWSTAAHGNFPAVNNRDGNKIITEVDYDGLVWCFEVPSGYFVTRRNGKITIQGNCKFAQADNLVNPLTVVKIGNDNYKPTPEVLESWRQLFESAQFNKDFKIFTTEAVDISAVGRGSGIYDTSGDVTQLIKEILIGLQVPSVLMDGGSDTTYANGGVALDVLRQRYMQFRNMLASWLRRKIFAPISKMNEFYEYQDNEKVLIVPEVDWNHMSLFDAGDYIQNLVGLTTGGEEGKRVAVQELHRSLGLDYNDQIRKIKKENISNAILKKEQAALDMMTLSELRALTDEDEIQEQEGQKEQGQEGDGGGLPGMPGSDFSAPDLSTPGSSEPPPPPPTP